MYQTRITAAELLEALYSDFKGWETMRAILLYKAPKYGNDVEWVDRMGAKWAERFRDRYPGIEITEEEHTILVCTLYQPMFLWERMWGLRQMEGMQVHRWLMEACRLCMDGIPRAQRQYLNLFPGWIKV